jgi:2-oxoglutarate/2-oxoacid ferredoxin oxidoreductase subunit beta
MSKITPITLKSPIMPTWCPGCGNFAIWASMQQSFSTIEIEHQNLVMVYGIGCSGNMADFLKVYGFHGLHGRGIANAIGIKLANHKLKVVVVGGDGDLYGEGLNHLIAAARGNHDITVLVHNNQRYSLTTGQTSPTSTKGTKTKSTPNGVVEESINPLVTAIDNHASFVARGYAGNAPQLIALIKAAILHEGFSLIDILQPCPTFNKENTYQWFNSKVYNLDEDETYDRSSREFAWKKAQEIEKLATGLIYWNKEAKAYHKQLPQLEVATLLDQFRESIYLEQAYHRFI